MTKQKYIVSLCNIIFSVSPEWYQRYPEGKAEHGEGHQAPCWRTQPGRQQGVALVSEND